MKRESVLNLISVLMAVISAIVSLIGVGMANPGGAHARANITLDRTAPVVVLAGIAVCTAVIAAILRLGVHRGVSRRDQKNHDVTKRNP